ncbi:MAG: 4-amino-4-deoxychorismate lyase [Bacteroidetes bacterium]|nr:MAG: 4-amino-4-deoxychorismate lyase [Bacteroidota bacterium]
MIKSKYICNNGDFVLSDLPVLTTQNRAFRYGDGLFETMHANGTKVQFLDEHFIRLTYGLEKLKMNIPDYFTLEYINNLIIKLLNKNKLYQGAKVRLSVFRCDGGLYTPLSRNISFIIETEELGHAKYTLNNKGLVIDIYDEIKKSINYFSDLKSSNALLFVLAGIFKKENNIDDCIILNQENKIVEAVSSNIFIVKNNQLYTPALTDGCIPGIMRTQIIKTAISLNYTVFDECNINPNDLLSADEVFLTNAISGIRWVVAYKKRRYFNKTSKIMVNKLNKNVFTS